jgi:hypothetical protein
MSNIKIETRNDLTIDVKPIVIIETEITIAGHKKELPVKITADFTDIPDHQHEIFFDAFRYHYNKTINVHHNTYTQKIKSDDEKRKENIIDRIVNIIFK